MVSTDRLVAKGKAELVILIPIMKESDSETRDLLSHFLAKCTFTVVIATFNYINSNFQNHNCFGYLHMR